VVLERLRLDGKVAVVTGAGRGLGQQMALALAEAGADVVCAARTREQIEATAEAIRVLPGKDRRAVAVPTDVRDSKQCDALIQACLELALSYAKQRHAFGKSLSEFQAIQFKLADMATAAHVGRLVTYHAGSLMQQGLPFKKEAAIAKLFTSEAALRAADEAVQIYGGAGYMDDGPVARYYRDAKILTIGEGTSEVQRMIIARELGV